MNVSVLKTFFFFLIWWEGNRDEIKIYNGRNYQNEYCFDGGKAYHYIPITFFQLHRLTFVIDYERKNRKRKGSPKCHFTTHYSILQPRRKSCKINRVENKKNLSKWTTRWLKFNHKKLLKPHLCQITAKLLCSYFQRIPFPWKPHLQSKK